MLLERRWLGTDQVIVEAEAEELEGRELVAALGTEGLCSVGERERKAKPAAVAAAVAAAFAAACSGLRVVDWVRGVVFAVMLRRKLVVLKLVLRLKLGVQGLRSM